MISSTTDKVSYSGIGARGPFVFSFPVVSGGLDVILTTDGVETTLDPSLYTVSYTNNNPANGGYVVTASVVPSGTTITIARDTPQIQPEVFTENTPTLYKSFEYGLDRLTLIVQELKTQIAAITDIAWGIVTENNISLSDVLTDNVTIEKHGFIPKLPNDDSVYFNGVGGWTVPAGLSNIAFGPTVTTAGNLASWIGTRILGNIFSVVTSVDSPGLDTNIPTEKATRTAITESIAEAISAVAGGVTNGDAHDHIGGDGAPITEGALSLSAVTTCNVSTTKHGFAPVLPNDDTLFFDGKGNYTVPTAVAVIAYGAVTQAKLSNYATGTTDLCISSTVRTTASTTYTFLKAILCTRNGTVKTSFQLKASTNVWIAYGKIYKNGSGVGTERTDTSGSYTTFTQDFTVVPGDVLQIYAKVNSAEATAYVQNFKIQGADYSSLADCKVITD